MYIFTYEFNKHINDVIDELITKKIIDINNDGIFLSQDYNIVDYIIDGYNSRYLLDLDDYYNGHTNDYIIADNMNALTIRIKKWVSDEIREREREQ